MKRRGYCMNMKREQKEEDVPTSQEVRWQSKRRKARSLIIITAGSSDSLSFPECFMQHNTAMRPVRRHEKWSRAGFSIQAPCNTTKTGNSH
jgi:hypothetical protein